MSVDIIQKTVIQQKSKKDREEDMIARFHADFPPLSNSVPKPSRDYILKFMRERGAARCAEYKERKRKIEEEKKQRYKRLEKIHIDELKRFLGKKWYCYSKIIDSIYDCQFAEILRYEDDLKEEYADLEEYCDMNAYEKELQDDDDYLSECEGECDWYDDATRYMNELRRQDEYNKQMDLKWEEWLVFNAKNRHTKYGIGKK